MTLQKKQNESLFITGKWYLEKKPHPENQKAFVIQAQFPWHREALTSVMVEISTQEHVYLAPEEKGIIHGYGESMEGSLYVYQLEEIIAEKVCAILDFAKKLHEKEWGRSRVRDYYDIWRILSKYHNSLKLAAIPDLVLKKCARKNVIFTDISQLFSEILLDDLDRSWERWLAPFVPGLPDQEIVIQETKKLLQLIWHHAYPHQDKIRTKTTHSI